MIKQHVSIEFSTLRQDDDKDFDIRRYEIKFDKKTGKTGHLIASVKFHAKEAWVDFNKSEILTEQEKNQFDNIVQKLIDSLPTLSPIEV